MKKHLFALSCSLVLGACASIPTSLYPGLVDEGGRFMQLITKHNGVVTIEFETPSNSACLSLAKSTDSKPNQVIKKCAVDSASNLKGYGILDNKILDRKMPMRFLTKDACIALSNEYKNNPNRPSSESIVCKESTSNDFDKIISKGNNTTSETHQNNADFIKSSKYLTLRGGNNLDSILHAIEFDSNDSCEKEIQFFNKLHDKVNKKLLTLSCESFAASHSIGLNHKGTIFLTKSNREFIFYSQNVHACNSWDVKYYRKSGLLIDCNTSQNNNIVKSNIEEKANASLSSKEKSYFYLESSLVGKSEAIIVINFPTNSRCEYFKNGIQQSLRRAPNAPKDWKTSCKLIAEDIAANFKNKHLHQTKGMHIRFTGETLPLYTISINTCEQFLGTDEHFKSGIITNCQ